MTTPIRRCRWFAEMCFSSLLFYVMCFWQNPFIAHFGIIDFTTWRSQQQSCRPSLIGGRGTIILSPSIYIIYISLPPTVDFHYECFYSWIGCASEMPLLLVGPSGIWAITNNYERNCNSIPGTVMQASKRVCSVHCIISCDFNNCNSCLK